MPLTGVGMKLSAIDLENRIELRKRYLIVRINATCERIPQCLARQQSGKVAALLRRRRHNDGRRTRRAPKSLALVREEEERLVFAVVELRYRYRTAEREPILVALQAIVDFDICSVL